MVTAETALAIPALVAVLAGLLTIITTVSAQLRCVAAARDGARAAARGEAASVVRQIVERTAPSGSDIGIDTGADEVTVTVRVKVSPMLGELGAITVSGTATAQREPTADSGPAGSGASTVLALPTLVALSRRRTNGASGVTPPSSRRPSPSPGRASPWSHARRGAVGERGSGTIYTAAIVGVLAVVALGAVVIGKALVAHHRAASAADLAALAAAQALVGATDEPCVAAARTAARNGAQLRACAIEGETVLITASVQVDLGTFGDLTASARARAGPV